MNRKKWKVKECSNPEAAREISENLGISPLAAKLLVIRGIDSVAKAKAFVCFSDFALHDPFLMPDMDKATARIVRAVEDKEKILVYGDYDVDGVTSVSILMLYFRSIGVDADYYIPDRSGEGYGINVAAIDRFRESGVTLMITVDTGVTAVDETEYAKKIGIDTVITDHHECHAVLPSACAVVNPRRSDSSYPFKELAGVGVVFKLVTALIKLDFEKNACEGNYLKKAVSDYIDLVAMGTIADVMPLEDENRIFVSMGLSKLNKSPRTGFTALIEAASSVDKGEKPQKKQIVTSSTVSYTVAPRINAAGRIDSAAIAAELFLTDDKKKCDEIAEKLCLINKARQAEENRIMEEALAKIESEVDLKNDKIIVLSDDNWHHGVIGIVASRITEKYGLPSVLISFEGDIGKGSGRSIKGINLVEALTDSQEYLVKFGGHELAAGLTVERENLAAFKWGVNEYVKANIEKAREAEGTDVDCSLDISEVTLEAAEGILVLEPFGISNPTPLFMLPSVRISDIFPLGVKHTRLVISNGENNINAVMFGKERAQLEYYSSDTVDILAQLSVNEFRERRSVQLIVKDIRLSKEAFDYDKALIERYKEVIKGAPHSREDDFLPNRDDVSAVYLYIKRRLPSMRDEYMGIREILSALSQRRMSYVKLRVILDILKESGVIDISYSGEHSENLKVTVNFVKNKVDIEKSPSFVRVKSGCTR
ncbi:MAG: single-stranded-DNA-specific exonuclease RecJ [Clostridia bacterium]|nr:single-stranded-DNA-specific exonuclease RecJ [Clostridia bacterium]